MKQLKIPAEALSASMGFKKQEKIFDRIINNTVDAVKILYLTPEKFSHSNYVFGRLKYLYSKNLIERFVIDEAHCVSQWGHEFRSDYLLLSQLKTNFPGIPLLALTATATEYVRIDIIKQLKMSPGTLYFQSSFNRPNLFYEIRPKLSKNKCFDSIANMIQTKYYAKTGLIYCHSVKQTFELSKFLKHRGLLVGCYNSKMKVSDRTRVQENWMKGQLRVIVATIAFGMGINKSDVRFVIHLGFSKVRVISLLKIIIKKQGEQVEMGKFRIVFCFMLFQIEVFMISLLIKMIQGIIKLSRRI
jgi:bloom syndrome protein